MKPNLLFRCAGIILMLLGAAGLLIAAPPANDNFANRIDLGTTFPTSTTGTNVDATEEAGEPLPLSGLSTVWWRWTATAAGTVEVNTSGSLDGAEALDTVLAVYTGTVLTGLVKVAENDESAAGLTSLLRFPATAGTTYSIQVLGYEGAEGSVKLNLKTGPPPPPNDAFASAVTLTTGIEASGTTDGATLQASESVPVGVVAADYSGSAWWAWTAPSAGWYRLFVREADDQVASVWTGTAVNALAPVHSREATDGASELYFKGTANTRYSIAVGIYDGGKSGPVSLTVSSVAVPPVYNASLTVSANAVNVTSAPATVNAVFRMVSVQPIDNGSVEISNALGSSRSFSFSEAQRTSGTSTDGTYSVPLLFPRYFEPGAYRISQIYVTGSGVFTNIGELSSTPFADGASRKIEVANTGQVDDDGPVVTSVGVTPTTVDVTNGSKTVIVTLQISDALSGFFEGSLDLSVSLAGGSTYYLTRSEFGGAQRTSGTPQNGSYAVTLTIPSDASPGDYHLGISGPEDAAGNGSASMDSTDPTFPGPFTGTIRVNRTPVHVLNSFTLSPPSVDVTTGAVNVTATCSITTGHGAFSYGYLSFSHPTADGNFDLFINPSDRTAGTATSGSYSVTFPVPRYLTPGVYAPLLVLRGATGGPDRYGVEVLDFAFPVGATTALNVANTGLVDTVAPVITFISASPNMIPSGSTTPIVMKVRVTDALSGVGTVNASLPDLGYYNFPSATMVSGNAADGVWELSGTLSSNAPAGVYAIQFTAWDKVNLNSYFTTNAGIAAQSITITAATNGYGSWASANGLSGTGALATSDPDQDGTGNFMEFAMGMNPQLGPADPASAAAAGLPAATLAGSGAARRLTLGFWVPADLPAENSLKLTYLAQFSSNGITWTDVPQSSFVIGAGTSLNTTSGLRRFCTVTDPATYSASQPRMGRIRATVNP